MSTTINALDVRRRLGRKEWAVPRPFGPDGWIFQRTDGTASIIASVSSWDGVEWIHASVSRPKGMPSYEDLTAMHSALWPGGYAYQCFVPPAAHVNIHPNALHLWGRRDGKNILPEFGVLGTI